MSGAERFTSQRLKFLDDANWNAFVTWLNARFLVLEEQLSIEREITGQVVARGLQVIEDEIAPSAADAQQAAAEIRALLDALSEQAEEGISADDVAESETRRFLTDARAAAIVGTVLGGVDPAGDTLAKLLALVEARATSAELAAVAASLAGKADAEHSHLMADIADLGTRRHVSTRAGAITLDLAGIDQFEITTADHVTLSAIENATPGQYFGTRFTLGDAHTLQINESVFRRGDSSIRGSASAGAVDAWVWCVSADGTKAELIGGNTGVQ